MSSNKDQIRDAILTHLDTYAGISDVLRNPELLDLNEPEVTLPAQEPEQAPAPQSGSLADLEKSLEGCTRCKLSAKRKNIVFGFGNPKADLMFVGEGPGADEDEQGEPFVGKAGQLLTKMIEAMGLSRDEVYIANVVKCRPPGNRNPEEDEIKECLPFLQKQIQFIEPKVIVALGKFAAQTVIETQAPISKIRGHFREKNGLKIMPTFHPSYLLRNPEMKRHVWEDLKLVMQEMGLKR